MKREGKRSLKKGSKVGFKGFLITGLAAAMLTGTAVPVIANPTPTSLTQNVNQNFANDILEHTYSAPYSTLEMLETLEILEIFQRSNEIFMNQLTIVFVAIGFFITALVVSLPLLQYFGHKRRIDSLDGRLKEIKEDMDDFKSSIKEDMGNFKSAIREDMDSLKSEIRRDLEIYFDKITTETVKFTTENKQSIEESKQSIEESKQEAAMKTKELTTFINLQKDPQWTSLQSESNILRAIATCHNLLTQYPDNKSDIYQKLGVIQYFNANDIEAAKTAFENALEYDPHNAYTLYMLARIWEDLYRQSDTPCQTTLDKAEEFYKLASLAASYNKPEEAKFYLRHDRYQDALKTLETCNNMIYAGQNNSYKIGLFLQGIAHFLLNNQGLAESTITESEINKTNAKTEIEKTQLPTEYQVAIMEFLDTFLE